MKWADMSMIIQEAIFGTKRVGFLSIRTGMGSVYSEDYKLYVHILRPRLRVELFNVANNVKEVYLVKDHSPLPYMVVKSMRATA